MKTLLHHKTAVLLALLLAVLMPLGVVAAPVTQDGSTETFDDTELPGWEHSPDVAVTNGALRIHPGNFALRLGDVQNPTIDLRVKYSSPGEAVIGYAFREEGRYMLHLGEGRVVLIREGTADGAELAQSESPTLQPDVWLQVHIAVNEGQHTITINGETVLTATDPQPLQPGALFLHAAGENPVEYDDLTLTGGAVAPEAGPPPGEPPGNAPAPTPIADTTENAPANTSLIEEFFASQASQLELGTFVINLLLSALAAYILSRVYIHWGASLSNRRKFAANLLLITITTTFIIMVVRSSVALSLGLVGALSIVRFRTAVKEPEELAYLFFAIGIGIGLGDNQRLVTLLALATAITVMGVQRLTRQAQADVNLHLTLASHTPAKIGLEQLVAALKPHCTKWKLLRLDENETTLEAAFLIEFRHLDDLTQAKAALRGLSETLEISFLDNRGLW